MSQQLSHQQPIIVANEKIDLAEKDEKIRKLEQVSGIILAKWQNGEVVCCMYSSRHFVLFLF